MKSLLWTACAGLAMTACSNSEELAEATNSKAISFQSTVGKNTRAIATNDNFSAFMVMAQKENGTDFFDEPITVTKHSDGDVSEWETSHTYYWQADPLNFFAYAPTDVENVTLNGSKRQIADFPAQVAATDSVKDLVIATKFGCAWTNTYGPVSLNFKHALAQICIEGRMKTGANMKVDVIGAKICFVTPKGTVSFPTATTTAGTDSLFTWSLPSNTQQDFGVCGSTYVTLTEDAQSLTFNNSMLMIPQSASAWPTNNDASKMLTDEKGTTVEKGAYLAVLCKMYNVSSFGYTMSYPKEDGVAFYTEEGFKKSGYAWAAVPVSINWVAGNRYTYILTFSDYSAGYVDPMPSTGAPFDEITIVTDPLSKDSENPKELGEDILGVPITFGSITVEEFIGKNDASHHPLN